MVKRTNNVTVTTYMVNSLNQVTNDGTCSYSYDANGNLTTKSWANGALYYTWDDENQLVRVQTDTYYTPEAYRWRTDFVYDGRGRLRKRNDYVWQSGGWYGSGGETRYVYDGMLVIQERDGGNVPTVSYTRGIDLSGSFEGAGGIGGLLGRSHGYASGSWANHNCYHADAGGNITAMVAANQTLAATYRYDPFGRTTSSSGALASANLYRFSSKPIHANSGLYYYGYRFYWPEWQRWPNRDPIGENGGINLYGFVRNRPVNAIDADGLVEFPRLPTIPSFPWPNPLPRPNPLPPSWPSWPRIKLPEDPISCGNRIKNEVWEKFAPGGQLPPGDPSFHYGHCVAHCRIQRECLGGRFTSWAGGLGKEIWDEIQQHWHKKGAGWEGGDMDANREGRKRGRHCKEKSCEEACEGM
jgi:RHS repeat-associated protein